MIYLSVVSREGGAYDRGVLPLILGVRGLSPGKIWKVVVPEKHFKLVLGVKISGLNLILKASLKYFVQYFASISAYTTGTVAGIQSKKKGNDQEVTKYLINDCELVYGLQTVYPGPLKRVQGSLRICRDGSMSTFSEP